MKSNTALATLLLRKHTCSFAFSYFWSLFILHVSDINRWLWTCTSFPSLVLESHLWTEDRKPLSSGFILTEFFGAIFYVNPLDLHRFCLSNTSQPAFKQMLGQRLVTSVYIFSDPFLILHWCLLSETERLASELFSVLLRVEQRIWEGKMIQISARSHRRKGWIVASVYQRAWYWYLATLQSRLLNE